MAHLSRKTPTGQYKFGRALLHGSTLRAWEGYGGGVQRIVFVFFGARPWLGRRPGRALVQDLKGKLRIKLVRYS